MTLPSTTLLLKTDAANRTAVRGVAWLGQMAQTLRRHPRSVMGVLSLSLTTFAVTAFGIAPLAPDASALPQTVVTELVALPDVLQQRDALAVHVAQWHRHTDVRASDTLADVFKRLGILDVDALAHARNDASMRRLFEGRIGKRVQASIDAQGRLQSLTARLPAKDSAQLGTHFSRLTLAKATAGWQTTVEAVPLTTNIRFGSGTIRSSLFEATDTAGVPDAIAIQIAEIFSTDIDFHRELRRGDAFRVVYESLLADGEPVTWNEGSGRVLAVDFVNKGQKHEAVWFQTSPGRGEYYDFNGHSRRRAFLASPLEFSRVTSGFKMRFHPILKSWRQHLGTDHAAPMGTPARTVGDGVVEFAGVKGGYGNVVIVKHTQQRTTLYAHLSRIDVKLGQSVQQGQRIGAVGATGWATGPHLHFEFRTNGEAKDPSTLARSAESIPLPAHAKLQFSAQVMAHTHQLQLAQGTLGLLGRGD